MSNGCLKEGSKAATAFFSPLSLSWSLAEMKEKGEKKQRGRDGVLNLLSTGGQGEGGEPVPETEPNKRGTF